VRRRLFGVAFLMTVAPTRPNFAGQKGDLPRCGRNCSRASATIDETKLDTDA